MPSGVTCAVQTSLNARSSGFTCSSSDTYWSCPFWSGARYPSSPVLPTYRRPCASFAMARTTLRTAVSISRQDAPSYSISPRLLPT